MRVMANVKKRLFVVVLFAVMAVVSFNLGQQQYNIFDSMIGTEPGVSKHQKQGKIKRNSQRTESYLCNNVRRSKHPQHTPYGYWQITERGQDSIIAYSAFYDDRPGIGKLPVIQVLTVSTSKKDIFCHVWYEGKDSPFSTRAQVRSSGGSYTFSGKKYDQYLVSCNLTSIDPVPSHVTLAGSKCGASDMLLPVVHSRKRKWQVEFGICVSISFGEINKFRFVEWMEMSLLLGVKEVHIYNGTLKNSIKNVFDLYIKEQKLFVHEMPPAVKSWTRAGAELGSPASMNDCMLRYMHRYRYILFMDLDEIIVPQKRKNYHDMLVHLAEEHKLKVDLPVYSFARTYFLFDFHPDKEEPVYMTYLRYRKRANPRAIGFPKSMVDPRRCLSVFNHFCFIPFPGIEHGKNFGVGTNVGLTHHYESCILSEEQCAMLKSQETKDDVMLKFKNKLTKKIDKRIKALEKDLVLNMVND